MKSKNIFFIIIIILFIFITYHVITSKTNHTTLTNMSINSTDNIGEFTLSTDAPSDSFGMGAYTSFDSSTLLYPTQRVNNTIFSGYLKLMNSYNISNKYLVMAFLNYQLIPFMFNKSINTTQIVTINQNKAYMSYFNVNQISYGYSDLLILALKDPYDYFKTVSLDTCTFKIWYQDPFINYQRFNIIYGSTNKPIINYSQTQTNSSSYNINGLFITKEPFSNISWVYGNYTKNECINYYINIKNNNEKNITFAIIQLLNYEQITTGNNSNNVIYGYLEKGEACSIPASIVVPDSKGIQDLIVLMITDPYGNLESAPGKLNRDVDSTIIARSVGINVN